MMGLLGQLRRPLCHGPVTEKTLVDGDGEIEKQNAREKARLWKVSPQFPLHSPKIWSIVLLKESKVSPI